MAEFQVGQLKAERRHPPQRPAGGVQPRLDPFDFGFDAVGGQLHIDAHVMPPSPRRSWRA
jgi:hypothetical protein